MIYKGLDEEEAGFLTLVADKQAQMDAQAKQRETEEVSEYRVSTGRAYLEVGEKKPKQHESTFK